MNKTSLQNENSNTGRSLSGLNSHVAHEILKEDQLNKSPAGNYHRKGYIYIHDLSGGEYSPYCYGSDLLSLLMKGIANPIGGSSNPAKHFDVVIDHVVNYFYISQNEWEGAQAFSNFDTLIAPFIYYDNLNYDQVKQGMQRMVYNLSYPLRASYQSVFSNLSWDFKCPEHMKNEPAIIGGLPQERTLNEFQKEMDMLNMAFLEVMLEGDKDHRPHTFPISTYSITPDFDWNSPVTNRLFELTTKFGLPYFMNYCGSGLDPSTVRSMCCLRGNTKIISKGNHGISYKNIKEFKNSESNQVLINGKFEKSTWFKIECDSLISTTFANGINVEFSPDHPCITKRGIIEAQDLTLNDWMSFSLDGYNGKDGSYDLGRFIGLYLAEGSQKKSGIIFSFNETEIEYIDFVTSFASNYYGATYTKSLSMNGIGKNLKVYNISINSKTIENLIKEFIGGNKAINKYLKSKVFKMSKDFRQGLFDGEKEGDGSTRGRICTVSKQLSEDLTCLISSIGGIAGITVDNRTKEDGKLSDNPLYLIHPYSNGVRRKYKNIYEYDDDQNIIWIKIKNIQNITMNINEKYVYDFEMDTNEHIFQLANGLITHNCRLSMDLNEIIDTSKGGLWNSGINTGSIGVVSINLSLLGYMTKRDGYIDLTGYNNEIDTFYLKLDTLLDAAKDHLIYKREKINEGFEMGLMPFTRLYLQDFSTFFSTIGTLGMHECCMNLFGKPIYECTDFVNGVLQYINKKTKEFTKETGYPWNLEQSPAEGASHKMAMLDKKNYPDIYVSGSSGNYYYTNSTHINVADGLGIIESLQIQQEFNKHYTGGTLFHIFAGEGSPNSNGVKDLIKNICTNSSIPYMAFTKAYAICPNCGLISDLSGKCPKCNEITDVYDRVTGYYQPVRKYNDGKKEEFKNRKRFF